MPIAKEIALNIWWAYVTTTRGDKTEFEGDIFQGPNAESLARAWSPSAQ
jgi:hypothetical protein